MSTSVAGFSTLSPAQQGAQWLMGLMQEDGSLRGATSLNEYYKVPFGLIVTGHIAEADRILDYIAKTYVKPNGDLDGAGCEWFETFRTYAHGWLVMAAMARGHFEMAHSLLRVLAAYYDERTGGFFATTAGQNSQNGPQEVMSTALSALACLWAGRVDIAENTGKWMERLYAAQPDLCKGLYFVWHPVNGLVTDFPEVEAEARTYIVDASKTHQRYFQYGISAAFLASLAGATRRTEWLELARKFLAASRHCREDVYKQPQSGKIGWGAAWTYRLSGDREDLAMAQAVAVGLRALQDQTEGWWSGVDFYRRNVGKLEPAIDVTGEFVGLLGCIELVLESRTWPVPGLSLF